MTTWQHAIDDSKGSVELTPLRSAIVVSGPQVPAAALAIADGRELWKSPETTPVAPVASGSLLILATGLKVTAIDTSTWRESWTALVKEPVTHLAASESAVIAVSGATVTHWRAIDGQPIWTVTRPEAAAARLIGVGFLAVLTQSALVDQSQVYLSYGRRLEAWDLASHVQNWQLLFDDPVASLVIDKSRLYVSGAPRGLFAIDARSGWVSWPLARTPTIGSPSVDGDRVYVASLDNTVLALDERRGVREWRAELRGRAVTSPRPFKDVLIVPLTSGEFVSVSRADGHVTRLERTADATTPTLDLIEALGASIDGTTLVAVTKNAAGQRLLTALRRQ